MENFKFGLYKHFKNGKLYHAYLTAIDSTTGGRLVIYQEVSNPELDYARPIEDWTTPQGRDKIPRFTYVGITSKTD